MSPASCIIELNVGGVFYTTSIRTLTSDPKTRLAKMFAKVQSDGTEESATDASDSTEEDLSKDTKGKYFIDRDGVLFRYILDFLRNKKLLLPENFQESCRLIVEAEYFNMPRMVIALREVQCSSSEVSDRQLLKPLNNHGSPTESSAVTASQLVTSGGARHSPTTPTSPRPKPTDMTCLPGSAGSIVLGYRGTFAFGRDGMADVCFRKLTRILVHGKVNLAREVFGDTLNESRDPDRGGLDRYTSRFFLKHTSLEQAFDMLLDQGFVMASSCGTGTSTSVSELKPGVDSEELRWNHYNEFVWLRK